MSNRMKLKVKEFKAPAAQQIFISVKSREGCANVHTNPLNRVKVEVTDFQRTWSFRRKFEYRT